MVVLSIVVPAYNVEKFIARLIESVKIQKIKNDIEVLIVSDGSTDNTENLVSQLTKDCADYIKLCRKVNGGHGSVINYGIEHACGKYFKVIDGDDWVDSNELIKLVEFLRQSDADLVVNNFSVIEDETNKCVRKGMFTGVQYGKIYSTEGLNQANRYVGIHSFTIKTAILRDNHIKVDEKVYYEDTEYVLYPIPFVKSICYVDFDVYQYRVGTAEQSVNPKNMIKNRAHRTKVMKSLIEYYMTNRHIFSHEVRNYYFKRLKPAVENQLDIYYAMCMENKFDFCELQEYLTFVKSCPEFYDYMVKTSNGKIRNAILSENSSDFIKQMTKYKKCNRFRKKVDNTLDKFKVLFWERVQQ